MWRSKKCWMPNLEGCCWLLLGLDFLDEDDDEEEEMGFFLGGIFSGTWKLSTRVFHFIRIQSRGQIEREGGELEVLFLFNLLCDLCSPAQN